MNKIFYKVGTKICTVGRCGSRMAGTNALFTGKVYEAKSKKDGTLVWSLIDTFGGTRSGSSKPSKKFTDELKLAAKYPWMDNIIQNKKCN